ncbi:MAG TPA: HAD family phosphatase [Vicinamibacterales bacterium]|nr:HAD family phosphatase [Vicinamibacterales bacterium]
MTDSKAVLWDLDGTLVNSEEYHWQSWRDALAPEGLSITYDQFLSSFGMKNDPIMRLWLGAGYTPERSVRIAEAKEADYRRLAQLHGLTPLPGAREWVARLKVAGWRQAIATSAPRANAEVMLAALGMTALFDAIVVAEDVSHGKPDPEPFLVAAERVGVPPARAIVVEDAVAGIEGARRAGMKSVGVNARQPLGADVNVTSLMDLTPDAFDRLVSGQV